METQQSSINPVAPENPSKPEPQDGFRHNPNGRALAGIIVITVGALLFARQLGADIPYWVFSWPMFFVALGLFIGFKHSFRNPVWIIPTVIGGMLLLDEFYVDFSIMRYFWPILIITVGLSMIFKGRRRSADYYRGRWRERFSETTGSEDVLDCVTVFGGVKKNIISKDFKGGEAVTFFGGTELNLMQADANQRIVLDLTQVFGGTKLIIPPHWKVNAEEIVTIFGGLNDKRPLPVQTTGSDQKIIVLKGTCIFGGIDIKSY